MLIHTSSEDAPAPPLTISFLFATSALPKATCGNLLGDESTQTNNPARRLLDQRRASLGDTAGQAEVKKAWSVHRRGGKQPPKQPWRAKYDAFYPVNALRNLAWQPVRLLYRTCILVHEPQSNRPAGSPSGIAVFHCS